MASDGICRPLPVEILVTCSSGTRLLQYTAPASAKIRQQTVSRAPWAFSRSMGRGRQGRVTRLPKVWAGIQAGANRHRWIQSQTASELLCTFKPYLHVAQRDNKMQAYDAAGCRCSLRARATQRQKCKMLLTWKEWTPGLCILRSACSLPPLQCLWLGGPGCRNVTLLAAAFFYLISKAMLPSTDPYQNSKEKGMGWLEPVPVVCRSIQLIQEHCWGRRNEKEQKRSWGGQSGEELCFWGCWSRCTVHTGQAVCIGDCAGHTPLSP